MNWVEMDYRRDRAIEEKADIVWGNVCAATRDAVDTFNRLYRQSKSILEYKAGQNWVSLSIQVPSRGDPPRDRYTVARISFDLKHYVISCKFTKGSAPDVNIGFDACDEDGHMEVFLVSHPDRQRIKDEESASVLMLRTFLKTIQNA